MATPLTPNDNAVKMGLKMEDTTPMKCNKCENQAFIATVLLRRISALVSPTAKEAVVPVQLYSCSKCGYINKEFLPAGITVEDANCEETK